ncbi:MAG: 3-phosphoshikimate 1-carboxyvinyltransferase [Bacteroidota bacterium]
MIQQFEKIERINGVLRLPGDKSISHRAVMFASLAKGNSVINNCSNSEDVKSTINIFSQLGIRIDVEKSRIKITGNGYKGLKSTDSELNAGNSGTTARLLCGILSAQNFKSVVTGDESLSVRPMLRVVEPLRLMGADIAASELGTLPLVIKPVNQLHAVDYKMKVASAQVKSAIILAGLHLDEETTIYESTLTRDHSERMLGLKKEFINNFTRITVSKSNYPEPFEMTIPSDISTAAFFIVLALLSKNSDLVIENVSLNSTRTGIIKLLSQMNGNIEIENENVENGEASGNVKVKPSRLQNIDIPAEIIPNIIDEVPILSVAGLFADGSFRINNAKELRLKESDRIKALCYNYRLLGLEVIEEDDGFQLSGSIKNDGGIVFESFGDHRIAMAFAVLSMLMKNGGAVNQFESVAVSNPDFIEQVKLLC